MTPVRWGFLGAGFIARQALAPAVHAAGNAVLQAVAARDRDRAAALEPAGAAYDDYLAVCDDPGVEAVYVALANDAHLPWTLRALAAGKHVLCEKPLGLDAGEVAQLAAAATAAGRLVVEAAFNRWHPRTRRAEELVAAGVLGADERRVEAAFTFDGVPDGNYRLAVGMGGGALYDVGCYAVSAAHWALDARTAPLAVRSAEVTRGPTGVDLTTGVELAAATGSATARASFAEPETQTLRVTSGRRLVEFVGLPFTAWHTPCSLRVSDGDGERVEQFAPVDPYRLMVEAVSARIRGEDAYLVPLDESAAVAGTLDAVRASVAVAT